MHITRWNAAMNMSAGKSLIVISTIVLCLACASIARADPNKPTVKKSNKDDVQASLKAGWERVISGKEFDHAQGLELIKALAATLELLSIVVF